MRWFIYFFDFFLLTLRFLLDKTMNKLRELFKAIKNHAQIKLQELKNLDYIFHVYASPVFWFEKAGHLKIKLLKNFF